MATTLVSLEEYQHTTYKPDMEYLDGVLAGRNMGTPLHSVLQGIVVAYFSQFKKRYRFAVLPECRMLINAKTGRHRIPDVMVLELPYRKGRAVTDVPAVVVEIQSPDDTLDEVVGRCLEYAALGIPNIVVLDPDHKRQYLFANQALQIVASITLRLSKSGVDLPFPGAELFAEMDEGE